MSIYTSSIINNYGDVERVKADAATLQDIFNRQGSDFIIDSHASCVGQTANTYKVDTQGREYLIKSLSEAFKIALSERL